MSSPKRSFTTSGRTFVIAQNPFEYSEANEQDWIARDIKRLQEIAKRSPVKGNRAKLEQVKKRAEERKAELEDIDSYSQDLPPLAKPVRTSLTRSANDSGDSGLLQKRKHVETQKQPRPRSEERVQKKRKCEEQKFSTFRLRSREDQSKQTEETYEDEDEEHIPSEQQPSPFKKFAIKSERPDSPPPSSTPEPFPKASTPSSCSRSMFTIANQLSVAPPVTPTQEFSSPRRETPPSSRFIVPSLSASPTGVRPNIEIGASPEKQLTMERERELGMLRNYERKKVRDFQEQVKKELNSLRRKKLFIDVNEEMKGGGEIALQVIKSEE